MGDKQNALHLENNTSTHSRGIFDNLQPHNSRQNEESRRSSTSGSDSQERNIFDFSLFNAAPPLKQSNASTSAKAKRKERDKGNVKSSRDESGSGTKNTAGLFAAFAKGVKKFPKLSSGGKAAVNTSTKKEITVDAQVTAADRNIFAELAKSSGGSASQNGDVGKEKKSFKGSFKFKKPPLPSANIETGKTLTEGTSPKSAQSTGDRTKNESENSELDVRTARADGLSLKNKSPKKSLSHVQTGKVDGLSSKNKLPKKSSSLVETAKVEDGLSSKNKLPKQSPSPEKAQKELANIFTNLSSSKKSIPQEVETISDEEDMAQNSEDGGHELISKDENLRPESPVECLEVEDDADIECQVSLPTSSIDNEVTTSRTVRFTEDDKIDDLTSNETEKEDTSILVPVGEAAVSDLDASHNSSGVSHSSEEATEFVNILEEDERLPQPIKDTGGIPVLDKVESDSDLEELDQPSPDKDEPPPLEMDEPPPLEVCIDGKTVITLTSLDDSISSHQKSDALVHTCSKGKKMQHTCHKKKKTQEKSHSQPHSCNKDKKSSSVECTDKDKKSVSVECMDKDNKSSSVECMDIDDDLEVILVKKKKKKKKHKLEKKERTLKEGGERTPSEKLKRKHKHLIKSNQKEGSANAATATTEVASKAKEDNQSEDSDIQLVEESQDKTVPVVDKQEDKELESVSSDIPKLATEPLEKEITTVNVPDSDAPENTVIVPLLSEKPDKLEGRKMQNDGESGELTKRSEKVSESAAPTKSIDNDRTIAEVKDKCDDSDVQLVSASEEENTEKAAEKTTDSPKDKTFDAVQEEAAKVEEPEKMEVVEDTANVGECSKGNTQTDVSEITSTSKQNDFCDSPAPPDLPTEDETDSIQTESTITDTFRSKSAMEVSFTSEDSMDIVSEASQSLNASADADSLMDNASNFSFAGTEESSEVGGMFENKDVETPSTSHQHQERKDEDATEDDKYEGNPDVDDVDGLTFLSFDSKDDLDLHLKSLTKPKEAKAKVMKKKKAPMVGTGAGDARKQIIRKKKKKMATNKWNKPKTWVSINYHALMNQLEDSEEKMLEELEIHANRELLHPSLKEAGMCLHVSTLPTDPVGRVFILDPIGVDLSLKEPIKVTQKDLFYPQRTKTSDYTKVKGWRDTEDDNAGKKWKTLLVPKSIKAQRQKALAMAKQQGNFVKPHSKPPTQSKQPLKQSPPQPKTASQAKVQAPTVPKLKLQTKPQAPTVPKLKLGGKLQNQTSTRTDQLGLRRSSREIERPRYLEDTLDDKELEEAITLPKKPAREPIKLILKKPKPDSPKPGAPTKPLTPPVVPPITLALKKPKTAAEAAASKGMKRAMIVKKPDFASLLSRKLEGSDDNVNSDDEPRTKTKIPSSESRFFKPFEKPVTSKKLAFVSDALDEYLKKNQESSALQYNPFSHPLLQNKSAVVTFQMPTKQQRGIKTLQMKLQECKQNAIKRRLSAGLDNAPNEKTERKSDQSENKITVKPFDPQAKSRNKTTDDVQDVSRDFTSVLNKGLTERIAYLKGESYTSKGTEAKENANKESDDVIFEGEEYSSDDVYSRKGPTTLGNITGTCRTKATAIHSKRPKTVSSQGGCRTKATELSKAKSASDSDDIEIIESSKTATAGGCRTKASETVRYGGLAETTGSKKAAKKSMMMKLAQDKIKASQNKDLKKDVSKAKDAAKNKWKTFQIVNSKVMHNTKQIKQTKSQSFMPLRDPCSPPMKGILYKSSSPLASSKLSGDVDSSRKNLSIDERVSETDCVILEEEIMEVEEEEKDLPACGKDFCRLGCVCDSLSSAGTGKKGPGRGHCNRSVCMFECLCEKPAEQARRARKRPSYFNSEDMFFYDTEGMMSNIQAKKKPRLLAGHMVHADQKASCARTRHFNAYLPSSAGGKVKSTEPSKQEGGKLKSMEPIKEVGIGKTPQQQPQPLKPTESQNATGASAAPPVTLVLKQPGSQYIFKVDPKTNMMYAVPINDPQGKVTLMPAKIQSLKPVTSATSITTTSMSLDDIVNQGKGLVGQPTCPNTQSKTDALIRKTGHSGSSGAKEMLAAMSKASVLSSGTFVANKAVAVQRSLSVPGQKSLSTQPAAVQRSLTVPSNNQAFPVSLTKSTESNTSSSVTQSGETLPSATQTPTTTIAPFSIVSGSVSTTCSVVSAAVTPIGIAQNPVNDSMSKEEVGDGNKKKQKEKKEKKHKKDKDKSETNPLATSAGPVAVMQGGIVPTILQSSVTTLIANTLTTQTVAKPMSFPTPVLAPGSPLPIVSGINTNTIQNVLTNPPKSLQGGGLLVPTGGGPCIFVPPSGLGNAIRARGPTPVNITGLPQVVMVSTAGQSVPSSTLTTGNVTQAVPVQQVPPPVVAGGNAAAWQNIATQGGRLVIGGATLGNVIQAAPISPPSPVVLTPVPSVRPGTVVGGMVYSSTSGVTKAGQPSMTSMPNQAAPAASTATKVSSSLNPPISTPASVPVRLTSPTKSTSATSTATPTPCTTTSSSVPVSKTLTVSSTITSSSSLTTTSSTVTVSSSSPTATTSSSKSNVNSQKILSGPMLIEIQSDCNWDKHKNEILSEIAKHTSADKAQSAKPGRMAVRVGKYVVEIVSKQGATGASKQSGAAASGAAKPSAPSGPKLSPTKTYESKQPIKLETKTSQGVTTFFPPGLQKASPLADTDDDEVMVIEEKQAPKITSDPSKASPTDAPKTSSTGGSTTKIPVSSISENPGSPDIMEVSVINKMSDVEEIIEVPDSPPPIKKVSTPSKAVITPASSSTNVPNVSPQANKANWIRLGRSTNVVDKDEASSSGVQEAGSVQPDQSKEKDPSPETANVGLDPVTGLLTPEKDPSPVTPVQSDAHNPTPIPIGIICAADLNVSQNNSVITPADQNKIQPIQSQRRNLDTLHHWGIDDSGIHVTLTHQKLSTPSKPIPSKLYCSSPMLASSDTEPNVAGDSSDGSDIEVCVDDIDDAENRAASNVDIDIETVDPHLDTVVDNLKRKLGLQQSQQPSISADHIALVNAVTAGKKKARRDDSYRSPEQRKLGWVVLGSINTKRKQKFPVQRKESEPEFTEEFYGFEGKEEQSKSTVRYLRKTNCKTINICSRL